MKLPTNTVMAARLLSFFAALMLCCWDASAADSRFAHSDSNARYLHHIDLYDANSRKITPESKQPYSTLKTCGRCHDYETISHGWHFNAFMPDTADGRSGEPWIWTDARTGTQLPLSYRDWKQGFDPETVGISAFEMTHQFGGRIPGGGLGIAPPPPPKTPASQDAAGSQDADDEAADGDADEEKTDEEKSDEETDAQPKPVSRWLFSGSMEIDCMVCHAVSGQYDFNLRREQVQKQNFAWAATAGLRLGKVDGDVSRIKDDADPADEATQEKLPKVTYDASRFGPDGTVFMDLVREPPSNSCYQCHSTRTVDENGIQSRWVHDEDVHLRAGMDCVDCHRNGIDHHMVRGFDGEQNPSGQSVVTLSCAGCHLGEDHAHQDGKISEEIAARPGRLGAPKPLHAGLPLIHFEKMTCTACHAGPIPRDQALGMMTSFAHGLGSKDHRTGTELPRIAGPVFTKVGDGPIAPQRAVWPAYWAVIEDGKAEPISPNVAYEATRRALRVRKSFVDEILKSKPSSSKLKELLGEDRYRLDDEWTDEEREKFDALQAEEGRAEFNDKVYAALEALEEELKTEQAAYVSAGFVYVRGDEEDTLKTIELTDKTGTEMVHWPLGHNVRPAGWSLGVSGCLECHQDNAKIFASSVTPMGPGPDLGESVTMASLQGVDPDQRLLWNELFKGRKDFKYIIGGSVAILLMTIFLGIGAMAGRLVGRRQSAA